MELITKQFVYNQLSIPETNFMEQIIKIHFDYINKKKLVIIKYVLKKLYNLEDEEVIKQRVTRTLLIDGEFENFYLDFKDLFNPGKLIISFCNKNDFIFPESDLFDFKSAFKVNLDITYICDIDIPQDIFTPLIS